MSSRARRERRSERERNLLAEIAELKKKVGVLDDLQRLVAPASSPKKKLRYLSSIDLQQPDVVLLDDPVQPQQSNPGLPGQPEVEDPPQRALAKSITRQLNRMGTVERLAFEVDPTSIVQQSVWIPKRMLLPDAILKRISIQADLVAAILHARGHHLSQHGHPRRDRHAFGFVVQPTPQKEQTLTSEEREELRPRIERAVKILKNCGYEEGWTRKKRMQFSEWLYLSVRDALTVGRIATEVIRHDGKFHGFRPIDAATIFHAAPQTTEAAKQVRRESKHLLEQAGARQDDPEKFYTKFFDDGFDWVQVIEGRPVQCFTDEEVLCRSFYPVTDWQMGGPSMGYPVTPLDTAISQVTMAISIVNHNKLYFAAGRASKGMLLIRSDDMDDVVIERMRQQFHATLNGNQNAWRTPIIGVGKDEEVTWQTMVGGETDMEFQYLSDQNSRAILSAYQMSPDELPGMNHLSRGTNSQALSEGNNEYRLVAARDVGLRPLIAHFQSFLNEEILPLIDEGLVGTCEILLLGLDAETPEKESVRLQQDMAVHLTYNEVMGRVEKEPLPRSTGADMPLNPQWGQIGASFATVSTLRKVFMEPQDLPEDQQWDLYDLRWDYARDPIFWQQREFLMQQLQMLPQMAPSTLAPRVLPDVIRALFPKVDQQTAEQAAQEMLQVAMQQQQMQAQQGGGGGEDPGGGQDPGAPGGGQDARQEGSQEGDGQGEGGAEGGQDGAQGDLGQALQGAQAALGKAEHHLPHKQQALLDRHRTTVRRIAGAAQQDWRMQMNLLMSEADKWQK